MADRFSPAETDLLYRRFAPLEVQTDSVVDMPDSYDVEDFIATWRSSD